MEFVRVGVRASVTDMCVTCEVVSVVIVTSRVKGLDLIEYLKNYAYRFIKLYRRW